MKEAKGDTIKEHILRYARGDSNLMINTYVKYEDKMIIQKIFEPLTQQTDAGNRWLRFKANARAFFRWNSPRFIKLFFKMSYTLI